MIDRTTTDAAYAAGLFDGEGSIGIGRRKDGGGGTVWCAISNTDFVVIGHLQSLWGGRVSLKTTPGRKPQALLRFRIREARAFLIEVMPYLIVKRHAAEQALEYLALKHGHPVTRRQLRDRFYLVS